MPRCPSWSSLPTTSRSTTVPGTRARPGRRSRASSPTAEDAFTPEGLWPAYPADLEGDVRDGPYHGLYLGAAGVDPGARQARRRRPRRSCAADYAGTAALLLGADPDACRSSTPSRCVGLLSGEAGVLLVADRLAPSSEGTSTGCSRASFATPRTRPSTCSRAARGRCWPPACCCCATATSAWPTPGARAPSGSSRSGGTTSGSRCCRSAGARPLRRPGPRLRGQRAHPARRPRAARRGARRGRSRPARSRS